MLLVGPTSSGMSNERIAFVRATELARVGEGGGVDGEGITVHEVPRTQAPAWLMQKQAEGYELDLKLWAGLWMLERNPDGSPRDAGLTAPSGGGTLQAKPCPSPRTSASMFSASNAEWPDAGVITSSPFGHALCRSHAFCTGQTTS